MRELDTGTDHLLAKVENGVGYLIMNRPEARNAMSAEMNEAMQKNIADFELNNEVRCIVPVSYTHLTLPTIYSV